MRKIQKNIFMLIGIFLIIGFLLSGCQSDEDKIDYTSGIELGTEIGSDNTQNILYVSTTGDDNNPGTIEKPFRSIQKGVSTAEAGDTIYIRGGIYHEVVSISNSGTPDAVIQVSGYPGEEVVLDGEDLLPEGELKSARWVALIRVNGDHVLVESIIVKNSRGRGIQVMGDHVTVRNMEISHIYEYGVGLNGNYGIFEDSEVYDCSIVKLTQIGPPAALIVDSSYGIMRRNRVHDNHNQGIGILRSAHAIVEDNVIYNNKATLIYPDNAAYPLIQRNLLYCDEDYDHDPIGIMIADEVYPKLEKKIKGVAPKIINNIIMNCGSGILLWRDHNDTNYVDGVISNNTILNIKKKAIGVGNIKDLPDSNTVFENNILHVKLGGKLIDAPTMPIPGISFRNNCWSGNPGGWAASSGDIFGNPGLVIEGLWDQPDFYKLSGVSPCINRAGIVPEVTEDFFGNPRSSNPDLGVHEYQGVTPTSGSVLTPASSIKDVKADDRFFNCLNLLLLKNIIDVSPDNTFRPNDPVTVKEFVQMTVAALKVSEDLKGNINWTKDPIAEAKEIKLITDADFTDYNLPISRCDMVRTIVKATIIRGEGYPINMPEYKQNIKDYSKLLKPGLSNFVLQAYSKGIVGLHSDGEFKETANVTRAEAAEIIAKFLDPALRELPEIAK